MSGDGVESSQGQAEASGGPRHIRLGYRATVSLGEHKGKTGIIRFYGTTDFASGRWVGIELDEPLGKNDGSVQGVVYFSCRPSYGLFLKSAMLNIERNTVRKAPILPRVDETNESTGSSTYSSARRSSGGMGLGLGLGGSMDDRRQLRKTSLGQQPVKRHDPNDAETSGTKEKPKPRPGRASRDESAHHKSNGTSKRTSHGGTTTAKHASSSSRPHREDVKDDHPPVRSTSSSKRLSKGGAEDKKPGVSSSKVSGPTRSASTKRLDKAGTEEKKTVAVAKPTRSTSTKRLDKAGGEDKKSGVGSRVGGPTRSTSTKRLDKAGSEEEKAAAVAKPSRSTSTKRLDKVGRKDSKPTATSKPTRSTSTKRLDKAGGEDKKVGVGSRVGGPTRSTSTKRMSNRATVPKKEKSADSVREPKHAEKNPRSRGAQLNPKRSSSRNSSSSASSEAPSNASSRSAASKLSHTRASRSSKVDSGSKGTTSKDKSKKARPVEVKEKLDEKTAGTTTTKSKRNSSGPLKEKLNLHKIQDGSRRGSGTTRTPRRGSETNGMDVAKPKSNTILIKRKSEEDLLESESSQDHKEETHEEVKRSKSRFTMPKFVIPRKVIPVVASDSYDMEDPEDLAELNKANNDLALDDSLRRSILAREKQPQHADLLSDGEDDALEMIDEFIEEIDSSIHNRVGPMKHHKKLKDSKVLTSLCPEKTRLVVFSLLGTLIDDVIISKTNPTAKLRNRLFNLGMISSLKSYGVHVFPEDCDKHRGRSPLQALAAILTGYGNSRPNSDEFKRDLDDAYKAFEVYIAKHLDTLQPMEGAEDTLRYLKSKGMRVAIGSSVLKQADIERIVDRMGWVSRGLVDMVIGTSGDSLEDDESSALASSYTRDAMSTLGVYKADCVLKVADSKIDIMEGKRAGSFTCGLLHVLTAQAFHHSELKAKPDFVLEKIQDIPLLFEPNLGKSYQVEEK